MTDQRINNLIFWFIFILGLALSVMHAVTMQIDSDSWQMISKGHRFVNTGQLTHFGNVASGGMGNTPGSLSSVLIGLPMSLWDSPYSPLAFLILTHIVSFFLLVNVFKNYFNGSTLLIFTALYWLSPWRVAETYLWNPSFLFIATAVHLWSAHRLIKRPSFWLSFLHIASIGYAFQIHNSSLILFLISLILFWRKAIKVNFYGVAFACLVSILSLVPYVMTMMNNPEISPVVRKEGNFLFRGIVYVFPMLKGFWYWVRFASTIFPRHIFQNINFNWVEFETLRLYLDYFWVFIKYSLGAVTVIGSAYINFKFLKSHWGVVQIWKSKVGENWMVLYTTAALWGVFLVASLSPIEMIHWRLLIVYPLALVPFLFFVQNFLNRKPSYFARILASLVLFFSVYNTIAALGSEKHSVFSDPHKQYMKKFYRK